MTLNDWAKRWNLPPQAVQELRQALTEPDYTPAPIPGEAEAAVQVRVRLEATRAGMRLWRNNVGAAHTPEGSFVRYGLANDSKQLNAVFKSSDLIGIRPVIITPGHVGGTIGQFVAREVKASGWKYRGTDREEAQLTFLETVAAFGGDACFAAGTGTLGNNTA